MFTDDRIFKYEEPIMSYDKATGNVTIIDPADIKKKKKIINSMDEVLRMKEQLYEEFKLDEDALPKGKKIEDINIDEHAKILVELRKK